MNFIACDGVWSAGGSGEVLCAGAPVAITGEEMRLEILPPALTPEESALLREASLGLFVVVFGFLVLRKLL